MLVDCTRRVEDGMPVYPGDPAVSVEPAATFADDGYRVSALALGTHAGTHVDAPSHVVEGGAALDDFDVDAFRFDARLVDLTGLDAREPVSPAALPDPGGADALVLRTGWADRWGTERYRDHPYLTEAAAAWCAERGLHVGLDAFSPDPTPSPNARAGEPSGVPAHEALLGAGRLVVENLCDLAGLPERFTLHAYPLRVDADGAPARAVAERER